MRTGIALGANLGERLAPLRAARASLLALHEGSSPALVSPLYETVPVDCPPDSPAFLNAVIEIETSLDPALLLDHLAALEGQHGRPARRAHHAPRPLDLDILYAGHLVQHTARLTVPHPRLARRRFVLQPLADLRPQLLLPGHSRTIAQHLAALPPDPAVQLFAPAW